MSAGTAASAEELPRFVRDLLTSCPAAGEGVNLWLFKVARYLHHFRTPEEAFNLLAAAAHGCGRAVAGAEITRAVRNSAAHAWHPGQASSFDKDAPLWPAFSPEARARAVGAGLKLFDLCNASPSAVTATEEIIDALFPGNPWLCCGKSKSKFATRHRETWRGLLAGLPFIVPSPIEAQGLTQGGEESEHCLDNTGPRRFLVIEQDAGTLDEQAAFLLHLKKLAPLALAVYSGHKSVHGWFYCRGKEEGKLEAFVRYCVERGADRATWVRSQFVRMPGGKRETGELQEVCYFNPEAVK